MSSYLTFYLVPKKTIKKFVFEGDGGSEQEVKVSEGIPLTLMSFSRSSDIYQTFTENMYNIAYAGNEEKYTELTLEDMKEICNSVKSDIAIAEERLAIDYKIIKESKCDNDMWENIHSSEEYIKDLKNNLNEIKNIYYIVDEITNGYTSFEKVLINIG